MDIYSVDIEYNKDYDLVYYLYHNYELIHQAGFTSSKKVMEKEVLKDCKQFISRRGVYNPSIRIGTKQLVKDLVF